MAEGDSMNFLPNVNTADLLSMLTDAGSLTDVFPSSFSIDDNGMTIINNIYTYLLQIQLFLSESGYISAN